MNEIDNSKERIKELIAKMILNSSYWGYLFSRVRRIEDYKLPSIMGVAPESDGTLSLRYNPMFFKGTPDKSIEVVLEHEGMHLLNTHIPRLLRLMSFTMDEKHKQQICKVFNIAADCAANEQMKAPDSISMMGSSFNLCHPKLYKLPITKSTEYYFEELMKKSQKEGGGGGGDGDSESQGEGQDSNSKGNGEGPIDDHSSWQEMKDCDVTTLARKIENFTSELVKESVKSFRGKLPGNIQELINQLLQPPQLPYYQIISKLVKGCRVSKWRRSCTRINRKRTYTFAVNELNIPSISPFPGKTRDFTFSLCVLIDTSGSVSTSEICEALSGIKQIIENDKYVVTHVLEVDTQIQKEYKVKRVRDIQPDVKGRGGTTLFDGFKRAKELAVDMVLCFTDGYCEDLNSMTRSTLPNKMLFIISKGGSSDRLNKVGWVIHLEKD